MSMMTESRRARAGRAVLFGVVAIATAGLAGPATADPDVVLNVPREVLPLTASNVQANVHYEMAGDLMVLRMSFVESDGASVASRVVMVDGQSHSVMFGDGGAVFAFRRAGRSVEVRTGSSASALAQSN